mmetsp:Transcript_7213/g.21790  ORF Transcript_7213/g.21790 Transcript_7213/m.21790 type:complete len:105 (+) Transcript_7213:1809-2123(+)
MRLSSALLPIMALLLSVQASADPAPAPGPAPDGPAAPSAPDGPAATSVCGDPTIDISGVTLMNMGACDPDGCDPPMMPNMFCCCEATGTNQFSEIAGGEITFGG